MLHHVIHNFSNTAILDGLPISKVCKQKAKVRPCWAPSRYRYQNVPSPLRYKQTPVYPQNVNRERYRREGNHLSAFYIYHVWLVIICPIGNILILHRQVCREYRSWYSSRATPSLWSIPGEFFEARETGTNYSSLFLTFSGPKNLELVSLCPINSSHPLRFLGNYGIMSAYLRVIAIVAFILYLSSKSLIAKTILFP